MTDDEMNGPSPMVGPENVRKAAEYIAAVQAAEVGEKKKERRDAPHVIALKRQGFLKRLSAKRRQRVVNGKMEHYEVEASDEENAAIVAHRIANPEVGDYVPGKGAYIGDWVMTDSGGNSLSEVFAVYADVADVMDKNGNRALLSGDMAQQHVLRLKGHDGHDGEIYYSERSFRKAVQNGDYKGGWIIPPRELLMGKTPSGRKIEGGYLYAARDKGVLSGTFNSVKDKNPVAMQYRSANLMHFYNIAFCSVLSFETGLETTAMAAAPMPCRLIRLEPKKKP